SGGVASFPTDARGETQLIEKADEALYRAKAEGRNRVCT
ncbi:diguanylate cyclase, partial [bacterium]|nr:diguanylate cyclase [bacterium]